MLASSQIPQAVCEPSALILRARSNFVIGQNKKHRKGVSYPKGYARKLADTASGMRTFSTHTSCKVELCDRAK